jgi:HlyD family secretion protein
MTSARPVEKRRRLLWLWIVLALALVFAVMWFLPLRTVLPGAARATEVETVAVSPAPYTLTVTGPGTLSPVQSRDITPEVTGLVASILSEGERVTKGQVLVQLETSTFERVVRDAEVSLAQAQAQRESSASSKAENSSGLQENILNAERSIANAQREVDTKLADLELKQRLVSVGSESSESVRVAQNAYDTAVATLEQAQLNLQTLQDSQIYRSSSNEQDLRNADLAINAAQLSLERAQDDLAKTTLLAPFDGVISDVKVKEGTPVSSSTTLLTLLDDAKMEMTAQIDETQIPQILLGQTATVHLDALPGQSFEGQVTHIAPAARREQNIPIFDVTILLGNAEGKLRSGMSAEADIIVGEIERSVRVPSRAIQNADGQTTVQVQQADATVISENVRVVATEGFDSILESDLPANTKVILPQAEPTRPAGPFGGQ